MNSGEDIYGMRKILDLSRWISIALLLLHFYYFCYGAFREWGFTASLSDRLLENIARTGLFAKPERSKLISLAFLVISLLGSRRRKDERLGYTGGLVLVFVGLIVYFGSPFIYKVEDEVMKGSCLYMGLCFLGWMLVLTGGMRLSRVISYTFRKNYFRKEQEGFPQEEKLIEKDYSLNFSGEYRLKGAVRKSFINIINARRGILLIGSPGSGKSCFIVEPAMEQLMDGGFSMLVFDFKYDVLTRYAYTLFCKYRKQYPASAQFCVINFTDLSRGSRCNLIDPRTLTYLSDAIGISRTILLSMNPIWANKQGDFFVESPINLLASLIWYLKKYRDGIYCTLPHVIELAQLPYEKLFSILNTEADVQVLVNSFIQAYKDKTNEMLGGQVASLKIPLGRLASPDLYYVLTGDDLDLRINDPAHPKILCLGGDPSRQEALAPILSLYIDRLNKLINKPGGHPCALILDEFATVRASAVIQTIGIGRGHNIIPLVVVQDLSQLRMLYTRAEADTILNMTGNLICGQVGGETARWVSERFPAVTQYKTTVSVNSMDTSISKSEQSNPAITPATIANLSSGEFVGILADDPDNEMELKAFHAKVVKEGFKEPLMESPIVREVSFVELRENWLRVKREVVEVVESEMKRILRDPLLKGGIVK